MWVTERLTYLMITLLSLQKLPVLCATELSYYWVAYSQNVLDNNNNSNNNNYSNNKKKEKKNNLVITRLHPSV